MTSVRRSTGGSGGGASPGLFALVLALVLGCSGEPDVNVPVKPAPASRHDALRDGLLVDAARDVPTSGVAIAYLAHHAPRPPEAVGSVDVALGAVEYVATTGDRAVVPAIDAFLASVDGPDYAEDTVTTARIALLDVEATRLLGKDLRARAIAHDDAIRARAFGDFLDPVTNQISRAYVATPSSATVSPAANVAMLVLKARLFRLTKEEVYRLEARAIFGALKSYAPLSLDEHAQLAFATTLLFEITGEDRFVERSDASFDAIERLRGAGFAPEACPGCSFQALWPLGYRRGLAGEVY